MVLIAHTSLGRVRIQIEEAVYLWPGRGAAVAVQDEHAAEILSKYGRAFALSVPAVLRGSVLPLVSGQPTPLFTARVPLNSGVNIYGLYAVALKNAASDPPAIYVELGLFNVLGLHTSNGLAAAPTAISFNRINNVNVGSLGMSFSYDAVDGGTAAGYAVVTLVSPGADNDLQASAFNPGVAGNAITIALIDPGMETAQETVVVDGTAISVTLRSVSGVLSSLNQVLTALSNSVAAAALVQAYQNESGNTGIVVAQ